MNVIVISGSVGVGKEKLARFLAKRLNYFRLDLHPHYQRISTSYDREKKCYVVDLNQFKELVTEKIKAVKRQAEQDGLIIDSHLAHLLPKKIVDLCIILTCSNLKKLQKNLEKIKYSQQKIRENLDVEIFQSCLVEAKEEGHRIIVFDAGKRIKNEEVLRKVKQRLS